MGGIHAANAGQARLRITEYQTKAIKPADVTYFKAHQHDLVDPNMKFGDWKLDESGTDRLFSHVYTQKELMMLYYSDMDCQRKQSKFVMGSQNLPSEALEILNHEAKRFRGQDDKWPSHCGM